MNTIKASRAKLLEVIKANRDLHLKTYNEAMVGYREDAIAGVRKMLADMEAGGEINTYLHIDKPTSHVNDYDRIITMLEYSIEDNIELTADEVRCYIQDQWNWKEGFISNSMSYINKRGH